MIYEMVSEGFISNTQRFLREMVSEDLQIPKIEMLSI